jgi:hypothetical protein
MVSSSVDIASQALALIRAETIDSFVDGTNEAEITKLFYDDFVQDIITRHPWSFATKKRKLNQTTAPLNEWAFAHILPAETQRVWAVFTSGGVGAKPTNQYDIQAPDGKRRIFSNNSEIWCEYTVYTAESNWPGYFTQFAIHAFAALICFTVTGQQDLADRMFARAWGTPSEGESGGKFAVAIGIDAQQKPGEEIYDSPFVMARFS